MENCTHIIQRCSKVDALKTELKDTLIRIIIMMSQNLTDVADIIENYNLNLLGIDKCE